MLDPWFFAVERQESVLVLPSLSEQGYEMMIDRVDGWVAEYSVFLRSPASVSGVGSLRSVPDSAAGCSLD